jgi:transposase
LVAKAALKKLRLSEPDATLLREELQLLELIQNQIKLQEARIEEFNSGDEVTAHLQSIPGMGKILAAVAAASKLTGRVKWFTHRHCSHFHRIERCSCGCSMFLSTQSA